MKVQNITESKGEPVRAENTIAERIDVTTLTDAELSRELSECRITLESIRPYTCREVSRYQAALRSEWARRNPVANWAAVQR